MIPTVTWREGAVRILDQTRLPEEEVYLDLGDLESLCEAIQALRVRGAPAIGVCAAYGVALLAAQAGRGAQAAERVRREIACLRAARPTAINLAWAVDRVAARFERALAAGEDGAAAALSEARTLHEEDLGASRAMGRHGADLVQPGARILTHCNTGGLATGGLGTALAVVFEAAQRGLRPRVFAAETRPLLQGARLTAWELVRQGIEVTVLVDGARAWLMACEEIDLVLVGADRVAANGDTANKIGTLEGAIAARRYGVPFYVVAPWSSFDPAAASGEQIPVELRDGEEVRALAGHRVTPDAAQIWNPAFDVTPAELITGWITDEGVIRPPFGAQGAGGSATITRRVSGGSDSYR